jgi:hypothetical protein
MSTERDLRKQLLLERVQSSREKLQLEVESVRTRFEVASNALRVAGEVLPQVGAVAASAAGAAKAGKAVAGSGGALGLAALVPVVLTVAKLVVDRKRKKAKEPEVENDDGGETPEDPAPEEASSSGEAE